MTPGSAPATPTSGTPLSADPLAALQQQFPRYRIWQEAICDRVRYIARSLEHGLRPHTVVTGDLAEMQAALELSQYAALIPFSTDAGVAVKPAELETQP